MKNKSKSFREILEIKDKIFLLQKVKNKENKREQEIQQFLKIIDEIEKVLELLEGISSKGYFEEINGTIKINKGNEECISNGKEYASVKELLNYLESIFEKQENEEMKNWNLYECINEYIKEIFIKNEITFEKIFEKSKKSN